MSTTTNEEQVLEARRRFERLQLWEHAAAEADRPRIRRRLRALDRQAASVCAAARETPDELDGRLRQLKTRLDIAERSIAADISSDSSSFAAAVETELRGWDTYLERLQTSAAEKAWKTREQTEAAIADVRSRRLEVYERLTRARTVAGEAWQQQRERVTAARDELEHEADELSAKFG